MFDMGVLAVAASLSSKRLKTAYATWSTMFRRCASNTWQAREYEETKLIGADAFYLFERLPLIYAFELYEPTIFPTLSLRPLLGPLPFLTPLRTILLFFLFPSCPSLSSTPQNNLPVFLSFLFFSSNLCISSHLRQPKNILVICENRKRIRVRARWRFR